MIIFLWSDGTLVVGNRVMRAGHPSTDRYPGSSSDWVGCSFIGVAASAQPHHSFNWVFLPSAMKRVRFLYASCRDSCIRSKSRPFSIFFCS